MHSVQVNLTKKQLNNLQNGKRVMISAEDIEGLRQGQGLFDSVSKGIKKATKSVSKSVSKAADSVSDAASDANQFALKNDIGGKVEMVKNMIPKDAVQESMKAGLMAQGMDEKSASIAAGSATGALYGYDLGAPPSKKNLTKAGKAGLKGGVKAAQSGEGFRGDGFRGNGLYGYSKGSGFRGDGFLDDLGSFALKTAKDPKMQQLALSTAKKGYDSYTKSKKKKGSGVVKGSVEAKERMARIRAMKR